MLDFEGFVVEKFSDILSQIVELPMTTKYAVQPSSVVPASARFAFIAEGLTSSPQALSSALSMPTFKILSEAFKSR